MLGDYTMVKQIDGKPWYLSKTMWSVVITAGLTVASMFGVAVPIALYTALAAFGLYGARTATQPIK